MTTELEAARQRLEAATAEAQHLTERRIKELTLQGTSVETIAKTLSCSLAQVRRVRKAEGVTHPGHHHKRKVDPEQLRRLVAEGLTREELAEHFNCDPRRIRAERKLAGLPPEPRRRKIQPEQVKALAEAGATIAATAEALGCSASYVIKIRHDLGISTDRTLTDEKRQRIEAMIEDGCSHREIARTLRLDPETLRKHYPGTAWTHDQVVEFSKLRRIEEGYNWGHQRTEGRAA